MEKPIEWWLERLAWHEERAERCKKSIGTLEHALSIENQILDSALIGIDNAKQAIMNLEKRGAKTDE